MGVSFKVSKIGTRYRPRIGSAAEVEDEPMLNAKDEMTTVNQTGNSNQSNGFAAPIPADLEVSFAISLFPPGYHVGKPNEMPQDRKTLHPYDRASENLFSAIEAGWLPGDILDDIPSKYYNGSVVCEVKDYRKCRQDQTAPVIHKVRLKMSLENVVKDVHFMSDDSWTYADLLEVESRIVKAMQPKLCLDPTPMLDRLCTDPIPTKLNLGLGRKRRSESIVTTSNKSTGKKVCIEKTVPVPDQQETGTVPSLPAGTHPYRQVSGNLSQEASRMGLPPLSSSQPLPQYNNNNIINTNNNIINNNNYQEGMLNVKKEFIDPSNSVIKKVRQINQPIGQQTQTQNSSFDELAHQVRGGPQMGLNHQLQQYAAALAGQSQQSQSQRFPANSDASFYNRFNNPKEEQLQTDLLTHQWHQNNNNINNNSGGPKRKTANSPRVPQSPVSSLSSGQKDVKMGTNSNVTGGGKRKAGNSVQKVGALNVGSPVSVSNNNNSMNMSGQQQLNVSSPSVATSLVGTGTSSGTDQGSVLERFAKLEAVANKHGLNVRKVKPEPPQLQKKTNTVSAAQELVRQLAASYSSEDFTDTESPMSLSLIDSGGINTYKSRILQFVRNDRGMVRNQYQLVLMEKPFDGTVGMQHGDVESDSDNPFTSPDCPLSLPNIHYADLLASQFSLLMEKDGYEKKEDQIRPLPIRMVAPPNQGPLPFSPDPSQSQPVIDSKPDISLLPPLTPPQQPQQPNPLPSNRMLPSVTTTNNNNNINNNPSSMPAQQQQGYAQARSQPLDQNQVLLQQQLQQQQQQQQQQQHLQQQQNLQQNIPNRSGPMMSSSNNPLAQMMNNKNIPLTQQQLQMLHQQNQQQMPRKVMMGMNPNNLVGLGAPGLSNMMGLNNMRNLSPNALTNMSQNPMNLSGLAGQYRPALNALQIQQAQLKQYQQRAFLNAAQNSRNINNISNNNAMLGNSSGVNIMSHAMNRANMAQFQMQHRPMGPPKIQPGGFYINNNNNNNIINNNSIVNNQQQQLQLQQQLQMQQVGSPLQQVGSPPQQAGSSQSGLSMSQQQQMGLNAMSPQQQISGINLPQQQISGGNNNNNNNNGNNNNGMMPASPQLSSQTQGSVGS